MTSLRVTCVVKSSLTSGHESIIEIGCDNGQRFTKARAIALIEAKSHRFYTYEAGVRAEVGVNSGPHGKFLQTYADGVWNNNLMNLRRC